MTSTTTSTLAIRIDNRRGVIRFEGITGCDERGGAGRFRFELDHWDPDPVGLETILQPSCPFAAEDFPVRSGEIRWISGPPSTIDGVSLWWEDGHTLHLDADFADPRPTRAPRTHPVLSMTRAEAAALRGAVAMWHEGVRPMATAGLAAAAGVTSAEIRSQRVTRAQLTTLAGLRGHHATQRGRYSFFVL